MSDVISFVVGAAAGAVGSIFLKGQGSKGGESASKRELETLYQENEKLRQRYKEAERQNEDLLAEVQGLHKKLKNVDNSKDDIEDALEDAKRKVKNLSAENIELSRNLREAREACAALERQIETLKSKS